MAEQVLPISQLHTMGLIKDTPPIALPPNAFSDVLNVRFNNGGVNKIEGERDLFSSLTGVVGNIIHIAWWANPNLTPTDGYYVIVTSDGTLDRVYVVRATDGSVKNLGVELPRGGNWQHTVYQGGYAIIINNGVARPMYILDKTGNTDMSNLNAYDLPGWDSYYTNEVAFNNVFDPAIHLTEFDLGREIDFSLEEVTVTVYDADDKSKKFSKVLTSETTVDQCTLSFDERTDTHIVTIATAAGGNPPFTVFLESGDQVYVTIRSIATVQVRCGVIRAWGDTLVAGNLKEINAPLVSSVNATNNTITFSSDHGLLVGDVLYLKEPAAAEGLYTVSDVISNSTVEVSDLPDGASYATVRYTIVTSGKAIRNQPGVVRISDVAAPGGIPHNWNPYTVGVSTAEEFTLATTGIIQDLVQMQGNLYVYTNNSIYALQKTGSTSIPYTSGIITDTHGALCTGAVHEFKGRHIIVGSSDIYEFSGHPASIQSLADGRVRDYFFDNVNPLAVTSTRLILNPANDEVWLCYSTKDSSNSRLNETLMWNYNSNVWSRRVISEASTVVLANTRKVIDGVLQSDVDASVLRPVFAINQTIYGCDIKGHFKTIIDTNYESYIERKEAPQSPEFDTEYLTSAALWAFKDVPTTINLDLRFRNTDQPGEPIDLTSNQTASKDVEFVIGDDYKADVRLSGRFMSFRITDNDEVSELWGITGVQFTINKGGRR
jgi:hypothetical protein